MLNVSLSNMLLANSYLKNLRIFPTELLDAAESMMASQLRLEALNF